MIYASDGVRKSAGIIAHNGTRLGALGRLLDFDNTSLTVSSDGWIITCIYEIEISRFFMKVLTGADIFRRVSINKKIDRKKVMKIISQIL